MSEAKISRAEAEAAVKAAGTKTGAAKALGVSEAAVRRALDRPADPTNLEALRHAKEAKEARAQIKALQARILQLEDAAGFYEQIERVAPIEAQRTRDKSGKRNGTIVTVASDWHTGESVSLEETDGRNEYDREIFKRRAAKFWDNVLWLRNDIRRTVTSDDHILSLNGDLISGSIHDELAATNWGGPVTQVEECAVALESGIRELAADCRRLIIPCVHGNHGRSSIKSRVKDGFEYSYEAMMFRFLRAATRDLENVEWLIPRAESVAVEAHGKRIRFQHGTFVKFGGGVGGPLVPLSKWAMRQNSADLYVFGHFHWLCNFDKIIVNGSLIGDSSYNAEFGLGSRPPEQCNFVLDESHGLRRFDPVSVT